MPKNVEGGKRFKKRNQFFYMKMALNSLIADLNYGSNIGGIIRTHHVMGGDGRLHIYDPMKIMQTSADEVRNFSCRISDRHEFELVEDLEAFLRDYKEGRRIATELSARAKPLTDFQFQEGDIILFGNERVGLSAPVLRVCDEAVVIPMLGTPYVKDDFHPGQPIKGVGEYPTYNTSYSHAIVMYVAMAQLGKFKDFRWGCWETIR
jgi:tRNA(Leu) C34 or U34 (ribose-2'-O)-methylase TrmL